MTASANQSSTQNALGVVPYLFFYGRCEEALEFYKSVFGGSYHVQRTADTPMAGEASEDFRNKVMHAKFDAPGVSFMCSDGREAKDVDPEAGNVSLALTAGDAADGDRIFNALSQGGAVVAPLADAFWGGRFGMINDRFGTQWMVTSP